jgi:predicted nucleotidyltransferase
MNIYEKINIFINDMGYKENPHVLGILFYGSYLYGLNNKRSDVDLHIIFDDSTHELIRGNTYINNTRIEYFEKPINNVYQTVKNDYIEQNSASLAMFGKAMIIYQKNNEMDELKSYVNQVFSEKLPSLDYDETIEQMAIINNRMERLKKDAYENSPYFNILFNLTIDKIRRLYHRLNGISYLETSKALNGYKNPELLKCYCVDKIPDEYFLKIYYALLTSMNITNVEKYELLEVLYRYTTKDIIFNENEYRVFIKPHFDIRLNNLQKLNEINFVNTIDSILVPEDVYHKIEMFINKMKYRDNPNFVGIIVYGSSLTGFNTKESDIDLQVIFDYKNDKIIRGRTMVNDTPIEYFEKSLESEYLLIDNDYLTQNNASFSIIGNGSIVCDKNNLLYDLKKYALGRFSKPMPSLSHEEAKEQVSILNNRIEKLENYAENNDVNFHHLYYLLIDRIRKFYHRLLGLSKIQTSKVYRIYTDEPYRKSMYKENPDNTFIEMYMDLITDNSNDINIRLEKLKKFYSYVIRNVNLQNNYRIKIRSHYTEKNIMNVDKSDYVVSKQKIMKL